MNYDNLKGIFPALMVAYDADGKLDLSSEARLVHRLTSAEVDGLYVGGSSAEMVLCSTSERMELLEASTSAANGKAIIAHVGAFTTDDTVALAKHARSAGAAALSSVTPLYFKYSFREIKCFYERICDVGVPVIIYNIPALTGTTLTYDQLCELLSLDGVGGMKFTSSDFFTLNRLKTEFPDKIIYNGADEMLLSGLAAGADGGIGTTYNFMPELFVEIYRLFKNTELEKAREIQTFANRIIAEVIKPGVIPASKLMLELDGLCSAKCREPFLPLTNEDQRNVYDKAYLPLKKFLSEKM